MKWNNSNIDLPEEKRIVLGLDSNGVLRTIYRYNDRWYFADGCECCSSFDLDRVEMWLEIMPPEGLSWQGIIKA